VRDPAAESLPVCRFWPAALEAASRAAAAPLATALAPLTPALSWTQNPNYRRRPPEPTFLDRYGYAVIAGPRDGPPALARTPALALGVLLLGPRTHYPLHAHPALEVYYTLTDGEWWRDEGPWRPEPPGTAIVHAPHVRHATRAGDAPLLAIYVWRGDLATHARLTS
jgi:Dimethlysulfonioproprionate lyase